MGTVRFIQHMLKCSVMTDQLNTAGESWSRFVSPQWARKLPADKSHLFCLVRPDMPQADYRLSAYKLKHTAFFFFFFCFIIVLTAVLRSGADAHFSYHSRALNGGWTTTCDVFVWCAANEHLPLGDWIFVDHLCVGHRGSQHQNPPFSLVVLQYFDKPGAESYCHQHSLHTLASWVQRGSCRWWLIRCFPPRSLYRFEM